MDFTANLIDLIRDPLSTILIDCRAITHLISQEESFQMEFDKVQKDAEILLIVFNQYLQRHIFADGQVRAQNQEEAATKQFFFETLIQHTQQFRSNLISLMQTVQSVGRLEMFRDADQQQQQQQRQEPDGADTNPAPTASRNTNRSLYALLKYKLQENLLSVLEATRGLMKACSASPAPMSNANTYCNNSDSFSISITTEYLQSISTTFLKQMAGVAECCSLPDVSKSDFQLLVTSYELAADQFIQLLKDHSKFDISERITTISTNIENLKNLSNDIHQWVLEAKPLDATRLQHNYQQEQCVLALIEHVKAVIPLINQSINKQASANPLPTSIELIDLVKLEQQLFDLIEEEEEEEEEDESDSESENEVEEQQMNKLTIQLSDSQIINSGDSNNQEENIASTTTTSSSTTNEESSSSSTSTRRYGYDLPTISLTENSDDEDEEPMIWSLPISSISSDPFKRNEVDNGNGANQVDSDRRSNSASAANPSIKVYSSKDFNIKAIQARSSSLSSSQAKSSSGIGNGQQPNGPSDRKLKGWTLKNPFRRSKSRENLHDQQQSSQTPNPSKSTDRKIILPKSTKQSSQQPLTQSLSQQNLQQPQQQQPQQPISPLTSSTIISQPTSVNSSPGFSSTKWIASLPSSRSMSNLLMHSERRPSTIDPNSNESSPRGHGDDDNCIDNNNLGGEVVIIESDDGASTYTDQLNDESLNDDIESFDHDYFDTPLGIRGSTQEPTVELFQAAKDFQIEEIGVRSKRYSNPILIRLDHNERHIEHYKTFFYSKEQYNFINYVPSLGGHIIISVVKQQEPGKNKQHRALIRTRNGVEKILIVSRTPKEKDIIKSIQNYLKPIANISKSSFKSIKTDKIISHLLDFEKIDITKRYHFFVMFCGDGQITEREMLSNQKVSREFVEFYRFLGKKVPTKDWSSYNGGLDTRNNTDGEYTIYTELQGIEIVFHISHLIPVERRKEILSRNTSVIIYHEGKSTLNPSTFSSSKNTFTNQTYHYHLEILFEIKKVRVDDGSSVFYKMGVASNTQIPPFGPMISDPPIYQKIASFKQYLITKLINAENAVYSTQHLMQELSKQRSIKLDDIVTAVL
ncbi:RapGAP/RanGAP domain-containing protein [Heterostelium album PN500]|uniref:RapGAP/RanGAP domain-containing protein n=1 Tax=Heterostelium pallidum (strain ATCC 26659 / Pp 5 / PN500) TaxID=670386 RepID=D3BHE0_HETP5|nr:RapGAP/RanGAP domain-containing protein [Heterostelium album PN500]EFA79117.1 RapGAP/RanGAP domain-containing protein [Heterostelium album PN500]|eukprot:XP_020431239.1 RapGAP/RanGAP domain-containing protein [Heterostelium album PN500]